MKPDSADPGWLWDMLAAARLVMDFVSGRTFDQYQADALLRSALSGRSKSSVKLPAVCRNNFRPRILKSRGGKLLDNVIY